MRKYAKVLEADEQAEAVSVVPECAGKHTHMCG